MLSLEIVTPKGLCLRKEDLVEIVVRRREERFEQGSEIAIFSGHAPLLLQNPTCRIRWRDKKDVQGGGVVWPGLVEVLDDRVLIVADRATVDS